MLGVFYIIDMLAPSPQFVQKMQPQSKLPAHGNDKGTNRSIIPSATSLPSRIP
jgi:hypothetical protein